MGFLDRLLGRQPQQPPQNPPQFSPQGYPSQPQYAQQPPNGGQSGGFQPYVPPTGAGRTESGLNAAAITADPTENERAVARYQYLLRTASPQDLERVHTEAFSKLTPEQRQEVLKQMSTTLPAGEKVASDQPADLARAATRAEMYQPGYMNQTFGQSAAGAGNQQQKPGLSMGKVIGGALIGTIAGVAVTSAVSSLFKGFMSSPEGHSVGAIADYPKEWASYDDAYAQGLADAQAQYGDFAGSEQNFSDLGAYDHNYDSVETAYADQGFADNGYAEQDYSADDGGSDWGSFDAGGFDDSF